MVLILPVAGGKSSAGTVQHAPPISAGPARRTCQPIRRRCRAQPRPRERGGSSRAPGLCRHLCSLHAAGQRVSEPRGAPRRPRQQTAARAVVRLQESSRTAVRHRARASSCLDAAHSPTSWPMCSAASGGRRATGTSQHNSVTSATSSMPTERRSKSPGPVCLVACHTELRPKAGIDPACSVTGYGPRPSALSLTAFSKALSTQPGAAHTYAATRKHPRPLTAIAEGR